MWIKTVQYLFNFFIKTLNKIALNTETDQCSNDYLGKLKTPQCCRMNNGLQFSGPGHWPATINRIIVACAKLFCGVLMALSIGGCNVHQAAFRGESIEAFTSAADAGFDRNELNDLTEFIRKHSATTGLAVLYKGKMAYSYGDLQKVSYIASCRKSVLCMLYGKYVMDGTIDLNQTIGSLGISERDGLMPLEKKATVNDIIASRSGVFHVASNGGYDKDNFLERGSVEPGSYYVYNNWDFNVAGHIFELYAQKSIYEELETQLAIPLGFEDWNIDNQKKSGNKSKSQYLAYHMYLSTRDMAKIGQLMLNEGQWSGKQLISKEWIKRTTSTITPHETLTERYGPADPDDIHMSYGYMVVD